MKKVKITVMKTACYKDLIEKYENPIPHACDMKEGQVFIANGWAKPEGFCDSAWESISPFVMACARRQGHLRRLDEEQEVGNDFLQRRLPPRELFTRSYGNGRGVIRNRE